MVMKIGLVVLSMQSAAARVSLSEDAAVFTALSMEKGDVGNAMATRVAMTFVQVPLCGSKEVVAANRLSTRYVMFVLLLGFEGCSTFMFIVGG